jgi:hypothetical protein
MNSRLERSAILAAMLVLVGSLEFGAGLLGGAAALIGALIFSTGATFLWFRLELPAARPWLPPLLLSSAVFVSTVVLEFALRRDFAEWFAVVFAAVGSGTCTFILLRSRARCTLCNRRLRSQEVTFNCPRCSMEVCDQTCWNFTHRRCELCLEQRVPILAIQESWWMRVTGPRAKQGRCLLCMASADKADLRTCPHCRRAQCRDCWDFNNGECSRCSTALPELPEALSRVVAGGYEGHQNH